MAAEKLLIVEDEPRIASFLSKGLRAQGYTVEHVTTGAEGLTAARERGPDLIVLDLGLPDIDGLEVLRLLRQAGDEVPVIVLTARTDASQRAEGLSSGANDYITKPFVFGELSARIRGRLRDRD